MIYNQLKTNKKNNIGNTVVSIGSTVCMAFSPCLLTCNSSTY